MEIERRMGLRVRSNYEDVAAWIQSGGGPGVPYPKRTELQLMDSHVYSQLNALLSAQETRKRSVVDEYRNWGALAAADLARQAGRGDLGPRLVPRLVPRLEVSLDLVPRLVSRLEVSLDLVRRLEVSLDVMSRLTTRLSPDRRPTQWTPPETQKKKQRTSPQNLPRWPKRLPAAAPLPPLELARPPWRTTR